MPSLTGHTLGESHFIELQDGRKLHYRKNGAGQPTVVFESGLNFSSAVWGLVQPDIAEVTTAVAYDRAGIGKSDWDDQDRTLDRIADDLDQLLSHLKGPFILVGYSWGGPIVRRLAARRTADIRALVLLDQVDEHNLEYFTVAKAKPPGLARFLVLWLMHTIGLMFAARRVFRDMPADCRREIIWRDISVRGPRISREELAHFLDGVTLMRNEPDPLDGIEVAVVTGTNPDSSARRFRPAFVRAHKRTAESMDKGRLVTASRSAHFTPITEPQLVIREILKMIELVRKQHKSRHCT